MKMRSAVPEMTRECIMDVFIAAKISSSVDLVISKLSALHPFLVKDFATLHVPAHNSIMTRGLLAMTAELGRWMKP